MAKYNDDADGKIKFNLENEVLPRKSKSPIGLIFLIATIFIVCIGITVAFGTGGIYWLSGNLKAESENNAQSQNLNDVIYVTNPATEKTTPSSTIIQTVTNQITPPVSKVENEDTTQKMGYVITQNDPLNIRENSDQSSKVIGEIPKGTEVTIISESGDWYEVNYSGKTGYVSKKYISFDISDIPQGEKPQNSNSKQGKVNTEKDPLNVRKQPSTDSKVLGTVPKGSTVAIVGESGDWYIINYENGTGYVAKKYILILN